MPPIVSPNIIRRRNPNGRRGYHGGARGYNKGARKGTVNRKVKLYTGKAALAYEKKCLAVMQNPHSKLTMRPKVPDGSAAYSIGQQYHTKVTHALKGQYCVIYLMPGLNSVCRIEDYSDDHVLRDVQTIHIENHGQMESEYSLLQIDDPENPGNPKTVRKHYYRDSELSKWRLVSQGMRIKHHNTSDDNEGSWFAYRIPLVCIGGSITTDSSVVPSLNLVDEATRYPDAKVAYVTPEFDVPTMSANTILQSEQHPSAVRGRLKNIGNKYFRNGRSNNVCDWAVMHNAYSGMLPSSFYDPTDRIGRRSVNYSLNDSDRAGQVPYQLFESFYDSNFDIVCVHVKGNVRVDGEGISIISIDIVSNHEIVPDLKSVLKPFESDGLALTASLKTTLDKMKREDKYAAR